MKSLIVSRFSRPRTWTTPRREFASRRYPVEVLHNWASLHEEDLPATNYRKQLGLDGKVVFLYGGNLGVAQDVDNIVRLAARLSGEDHIRFLLVGDGSEAARLKRSLAENGLDTVQVLPAVSHREYLAMLSEFDVGLLYAGPAFKNPQRPGKTTRVHVLEQAHSGEHQSWK